MIDSIDTELEPPGKMLGFRGIFEACSNIVDQTRRKPRKIESDWKTLEVFSALQALLFEEILSKSSDVAPVLVMRELIERNENDLPPRAKRIAKNMHTALIRLEKRLAGAPRGMPVEDVLRMFRDESLDGRRRMAEYGAHMDVSVFLFKLTKDKKLSLADIAKSTGISLVRLAEAASSRALERKGLELKDLILIGEVYDARVHLSIETNTKPREDSIRDFFKPTDLENLIPRQESLSESELRELPRANLGAIVSLTQVRADREKMHAFKDAVTVHQASVSRIREEWFDHIENGSHIRTTLQRINSLIASMNEVGRDSLGEGDMRALFDVAAKYFDFTARNLIGMYHFELREKLIPLTLRFSQLQLFTQEWQDLMTGKTAHVDIAATLGMVVATVNYLNQHVEEILQSSIQTEYGHVRIALRKLQELLQALRGVLPEEVVLKNDE